ncbi:hypothetical protein GZH47_10285 [Paenibacillus rhizovicinus]|uniref:DUF4830 domain-containing protein n=1 Tax=Paenibacillus rhizovicinus TaxID=2704463 RepID=A0A6C0NYD1_9BACL|nr:hypothetical protein [Paenibacillus rhizovicinus]QHW31208.1 hypothetical protein GZH47_10285 [Paenibacillus rhizovicinus]
MRGVRFAIVLGILLQLLVGCSQAASSPGDEQTAEQYVKAHDYKVTASKGKVDSFTLDKSKLIGGTDSLGLDALKVQQIWGVQTEEPDTYFGKEITVYGFVVSNHPLEKIYKVNTSVFVMVCEGDVIGAFAAPDAQMFGSVYSFAGETLEEVTGLSYDAWRTQWLKKYGGS